MDNKIDKLPINEEVKKSVCKQIVRLKAALEEQKEHVVAVSARTGEFLADNFKNKGCYQNTGFCVQDYKKIEKCRDFVILMSSRIANERPTAQDLLSYLKNGKVKLSLIVCGDGTLYGIYGVSKDFESIYKEEMDRAEEQTSDMDEINHIVTDALYALNEGNKLFDVRVFQFII